MSAPGQAEEAYLRGYREGREAERLEMAHVLRLCDDIASGRLKHLKGVTITKRMEEAYQQIGLLRGNAR